MTINYKIVVILVNSPKNIFHDLLVTATAITVFDVTLSLLNEHAFMHFKSRCHFSKNITCSAPVRKALECARTSGNTVFCSKSDILITLELNLIDNDHVDFPSSRRCNCSLVSHESERKCEGIHSNLSFMSF